MLASLALVHAHSKVLGNCSLTGESHVIHPSRTQKLGRSDQMLSNTIILPKNFMLAMHWMSFLVAHILLSCNVLYQPYIKLAKYGQLALLSSSTALALTWKVVFVNLYASKFDKQTSYEYKF